MSSTEEMQKLIIRGAIAEEGAEDKFNEFLEELRNKEQSITDEKDKAVFYMAFSYFALELHAKL